MLVGNKNDLRLEKLVSTDEGKRTAESWKAAFLETSAKENQVSINIEPYCLHLNHLISQRPKNSLTILMKSDRKQQS